MAEEVKEEKKRKFGFYHRKGEKIKWRSPPSTRSRLWK